MKKSLSALALIVSLSFFQLLHGQAFFKVGPSVTQNFEDGVERFLPNYGLELTFEFGITEKISIASSALAHYGTHDLFGYEPVIQKNTMVGVSSEFRFNPKACFNGVFFGVGGDLKMLQAKNFFAPTERDPSPTLLDLEINLGISFGGNIPVGKNLLTPFVYVGGDFFSRNEYPVHSRMGIKYGF